jgi:hypothetical protein
MIEYKKRGASIAKFPSYPSFYRLTPRKPPFLLRFRNDGLFSEFVTEFVILKKLVILNPEPLSRLFQGGYFYGY